MRSIFSYCLMPAFIGAFLLFGSELSWGGNGEEMTPEKLIEAHVKSVGRPEYLAKIQSRMFLGTSKVEFIQGMNGDMNGTSMLISQGPKLGIVMKYGDINYPGEYFAYDSKDVTVGHMSPGQRSPIGDFVFRFNKLVKGGLIGGTLTSSWPLLDMKDKKVDMKYRRVKIEGRELHELEYHPRSGFGDIQIKMYFDLTTFRHVRTEYKVHTSNDASIETGQANEGSSANDPYIYSPVARKINNQSDQTLMGGIGSNGPESYYLLIEKFHDYKRVGGLMLPHKYTLEYSIDGIGQSFIGHWFVNINKWGFNAQNVDEKLFRAHK